MTRWNDRELENIKRHQAENRAARHAAPPEQREENRPKSDLRVEVLVSNLSGYKRGDRVVLDHMTPDQVSCLVESGAVRPAVDERPSEADELKEASDG